MLRSSFLVLSYCHSRMCALFLVVLEKENNETRQSHTICGGLVTWIWWWWWWRFFSVIAHGLCLYCVCNVCSIKVGDWNKILKNMHGWQYNVLAKKWFHANQIVVLNMIRSNLYKVFWFQCDNQLHMKWEIILYASHVMDTKKISSINNFRLFGYLDVHQIFVGLRKKFCFPLSL